MFLIPVWLPQTRTCQEYQEWPLVSRTTYADKLRGLVAAECEETLPQRLTVATLPAFRYQWHINGFLKPCPHWAALIGRSTLHSLFGIQNWLFTQASCVSWFPQYRRRSHYLPSRFLRSMTTLKYRDPTDCSAITMFFTSPGKNGISSIKILKRHRRP